MPTPSDELLEWMEAKAGLLQADADEVAAGGYDAQAVAEFRAQAMLWAGFAKAHREALRDQATLRRLMRARLGTKARPPLSPETAARFMESVISEISETTWCAGWSTGVEYAVWHYLQVGDKRGSWLDVTAEQADDLRALSQMAGGWVAWEGEGMASGPRFVPSAEWAQRYREWLAAVEARKPKGD